MLRLGVDLGGTKIEIVALDSRGKPSFNALQNRVQLKTPRDLATAVARLRRLIDLDTDPAAVSQFVLEHKLPWPQIFFPEPDKRGWNNPIASYYGLMDLPALWLIDPSGNVVSTTVTLNSLEEEVQKLLPQEAIPAASSSAKPKAEAVAAEEPPAESGQRPRKVRK